MFDSGSVVGHWNLDSSGYVSGANAMHKSNETIAGGMFKAQLAYDIFKKAAQEVVKVIKESVDEWNQHAFNIAQTEAVLKSTGYAAGMTKDSVMDLASTMSDLTGIEDDTIQEAENLLLTFTKVGKDIFPQATETILDMSVALKQSEKATTIQVGKMLQNADAMSAAKKMGVSFTDEQIKMGKALFESGHIAEYQAMVLKELQTEFGGSAKAARDTFGGALKALDNAIGDVKEAIGGFIAGDARGFVEFFINSAKNVQIFMDVHKVEIQNFISLVSSAFQVVGAVVGAVFGVVMELSKFVTSLTGAFSEFVIMSKKADTTLTDQSDTILALADRYDVLNKIEKKSAGQREEMQGITEKLNKVLGASKTAFLLEAAAAGQSVKQLANRELLLKAEENKKAMLDKIRVLTDQLTKAEKEKAFADKEAAKQIAAVTKEAEALAGNEFAVIRWGGDYIEASKAVAIVTQEMGVQTGKYNHSVADLGAQLFETKQQLADTEKKLKELSLQGDVKIKIEVDKDSFADAVNDAKNAGKTAEELAKEQHDKIMAGYQESSNFFSAAINENQRWMANQVMGVNQTIETDTKQTWEDIAESIKKSMDEVFGYINTIYSGLTGISDQYFQNREIQLDNDYQKEINTIEGSKKSEEEKTKAKEKLDKEYAKKRAKLKTDEAVMDKTQAIAKSLIDTASAVVEALPNIPLSIIVGGLGLAQTAMIAAQPIPGMKGGGNLEAGQMAWVGEDGPELFRPKTAGTIYSNQQSAAMESRGLTGGGNVDTLISNLQAVEAAKLYAFIAAAMRNKKILVPRGALVD